MAMLRQLLMQDRSTNKVDSKCKRELPVYNPVIDIKSDKVTITRSSSQKIPVLPKNLSFRPSCIPGASYGIWSVNEIPKDFLFGPYYEDIFDLENQINVSKTNSENECNWMLYINQACQEEQQNLLKLQKDDEIYYQTLKIIPPDTELLFWNEDKKKKTSRKYSKISNTLSSVKNIQKANKLSSKAICSRSLNHSSCKLDLSANYKPKTHQKIQSKQSAKTLTTISSAKTNGKTPLKGKVYNRRSLRSNTLRARKICIREKPYMCDVCEKKYIQKQNFERHILVHKKKKL